MRSCTNFIEAVRYRLRYLFSPVRILVSKYGLIPFRKGYMKKKKRQFHLYLSDQTYEALKCCAYERGGTMTYYITRALQLFLLKGDYYRKAVDKYHGN